MILTLSLTTISQIYHYIHFIGGHKTGVRSREILFKPSLKLGQTLSHKAVLSTHQNACGQILTTIVVNGNDFPCR